YTCEGQLIPVWETEGTPVAVGRTQRIVPDRTRKLIEDRDKGCRFPDCTSKGYLEVHHMAHWRDGGTTDPDNLLCLCSRHHDEHHRGSFTISGDPERVDGLIFKNHTGRLIHPPRPKPPPPGDRPPPQWDGPTGEHLDMRWITFSKRRTRAA
ncbi:HNH endonuclease, partial [Ruaniaceae bacterium KH17]